MLTNASRAGALWRCLSAPPAPLPCCTVPRNARRRAAPLALCDSRPGGCAPNSSPTLLHYPGLQIYTGGFACQEEGLRETRVEYVCNITLPPRRRPVFCSHMAVLRQAYLPDSQGLVSPLPLTSSAHLTCCFLKFEKTRPPDEGS